MFQFVSIVVWRVDIGERIIKQDTVGEGEGEGEGGVSLSYCRPKHSHCCFLKKHTVLYRF